MIFNNQHNKTSNYLSIYCDGGARGNPGPAAIGFYIKDSNNQLLVDVNEFIGKATNNVAEYTAVLKALEWLKKNKHLAIKKVNFFLDSQLVVKQLNGLYKVKNSGLQALIIQIKILENQFTFPVFYYYVPREQNKNADKLVNIALNKALYQKK